MWVFLCNITWLLVHKLFLKHLRHNLKRMLLKVSKGWSPLIFMPGRAVFGNSIFDIRRSKCKRAKEPENFTTLGILSRTCNMCRFNARERTRAVQSIRVRAALAIHYDHEHDDVAAAVALLSLSSSASASISSDDYFVDEPDPEPEP